MTEHQHLQHQDDGTEKYFPVGRASAVRDGVDREIGADAKVEEVMKCNTNLNIFETKNAPVSQALIDSKTAILSTQIFRLIPQHDAERKAFIMTLPNEVMNKLASFVSFETAKCLRLVNKQFAQVFARGTMYRIRIFQTGGSRRSLRALLDTMAGSRTSSIRSIYLKQEVGPFAVEGLKRIAWESKAGRRLTKRLSNLRVLDINLYLLTAPFNIQGRLLDTASRLNHFFKGCTRVQALRLELARVAGILPRCFDGIVWTQLSELHLEAIQATYKQLSDLLNRLNSTLKVLGVAFVALGPNRWDRLFVEVAAVCDLDEISFSTHQNLQKPGARGATHLAAFTQAFGPLTASLPIKNGYRIEWTKAGTLRQSRFGYLPRASK